MIIVIANKKSTELQDKIEALSRLKKELKENDIAKEICKEHGFSIDIIDGIPIEFEEDIGASAKTIDSHIKLNESLLDESFEVMMRYAIHELVHALQHMKLEGIDPYAGEEYLDREDELEAFKYQIEYDAEERGVEEAHKYVNDLIEYHEVPEDKVEDKKEELLERI